MAFHSIKITLAATNTAQAPTVAQLQAALITRDRTTTGEPLRKAWRIWVTNDGPAAGRVGGPETHLGNKIGIGMAIAGTTDLGEGNHDVCTTYVSGTINDTITYTWLTS